MKDFFKRISSRKFIFWVTATVALFVSVIEPWHWLIASGIFIGGKTLEVLLSAAKGKSSE